MLNVRLAGGHPYGKQLFTWLSLVVSLMASFCAILFPDVFLFLSRYPLLILNALLLSYHTLYAMLRYQGRHRYVTIVNKTVYIDIKVASSRRHSAKVLKTTAGNSIVATGTNLWRHFTPTLRGACHALYAMPLSNYTCGAT